MKHLILLLALASAAPAWAQAKAEEHSAHHPASAAAADEMVDGEIRKVDKGSALSYVKHIAFGRLRLSSCVFIAA